VTREPTRADKRATGRLKRSTLTDDIARDLYEAREQLDARGGYRHGVKSNVTNVTYEKSWGQYLEEVGLQRMTVHRWLDYYEPTEQRLLTDAEYELIANLPLEANRRPTINLY
jgi:hypothetical protein